MAKVSCPVLCRKFFLLLWKNFVLQIRRPIGTLFELLIPPLAVVFVIALRFGLFEVEDQCFVTFDSDHLTLPAAASIPNLTDFDPTLHNLFQTFRQNYTIFYTPDNNDTGHIAQRILENLGNQEAGVVVSVSPVSSEAELVQKLQEVERVSFGCFIGGAGIVFNELQGNDMKYTLRLRHEVGSLNTWFTRLTSPIFQFPGPRVEDNFYLSEGFLHLENAVGQSIIEWKANKTVDFTVDVRQFPYPAYRKDFFLEIIGSILPLLLMLAFIYSAGIFVKELVLEKETRIRESMLMMGLSQWVLWSTWYLKQFIFLFVSAVIMAALLKGGQVFPESDFFLILIFLTLFILSSISFGFMVSVMFNSARVGLLVGFLSWFLSYLPYFFIPPRYEELDIGSKVAACLLSNTCLGLGVTVISQLEIRQEGLLWSNAGEPLSSDDSFHMGYVYLMLIVDALVYYIVAWYVNAVKPGQYGVPKPLYFPFLPSYWIGRPLTSKVVNASKILASGDGWIHDPSVHEEEPRKRKIGVSIQNLTKIYDTFFMHRKKAGGRKVAVRQLTLNMYKGQITALLGHNGAGKTTAISMLTGLYTPTSGTAIINDHDIVTDMDQIRRSLGVCPQHNVLFDRLTVWEHLSFFCRLKDVWGEQTKKEVESMITDLQLEDRKDCPISQLSGGMKRKLSVGMALVGGSEIVFLDEPTSGMDPYARRATWDLLIKHKKDRTILLTTHFMDEADLLGDRIAIMAEGRLRCSGSSLFLKSRFGVGYHMVIVKGPTCNSAKVTELVKFIVEDAQQVTDVGAELSFILPSTSTVRFPALFEALEGRKGELDISTYGVSVTTMEEVFIKVGIGIEETLEHRKLRSQAPTCPDSSVTHMEASSARREYSQEPSVMPGNCRGPPDSLDSTEDLIVDYTVRDVEPVQDQNGVVHDSTSPASHCKSSSFSMGVNCPFYTAPNSGFTLWFQQLYALFRKRIYVSWRFWAAWISQFLLPIFFVVLALVLAKTIPQLTENNPERSLSLRHSAPSGKTILFWADFTHEQPVDFSKINPSNLGASSLYNYTGDVQEIINSVVRNRYNETTECCEYRYQLLDMFCATRTPDDLAQCDNDNFGFKECAQCLRCCKAQSAQLPSCTRPLSVVSHADLEDYCPRPPLISISTTEEENPTGRLDDDNVYVAEHLLTLANKNLPSVFFRQQQAGFVVTSNRKPAFSFCGCSDPYAYCPSTNPECDSVDVFTATAMQQALCEGTDTCADDDRNESVGAIYLDQPPQVTVTVWYNNQPFHMSAAALNVLHNIWLHQAMEDNDISISVYNHPLPRNITGQIDNASETFNGFAVGTLTVFGFSFLVATFILFVLQEKETKAKHLQYVSGVHTTTYWTANFLWDLTNSFVAVIISTVLFAAFQLDAYSGDGLAAVFLLLLLTVWASIPLTYCFSFLFTNSLSAFGVLILFYYFSSFLLQTIVFLLDDQETADKLHYISLIIPSYGLTIGLSDIYANNVAREVCTTNERATMLCNDPNSGIRYVDSPLQFARPGIGSILLYMALEGIFFFMLTLLLERSFFYHEIRGMLCSGMTVSPETPLPTGKDSDVFDEEMKVLSCDIDDDDDIVVVKNLSKVYSRSLNGCTIRPPKTAVDGISLIIPKGECFGLLGVNGAGKTTTFGILTGDISPTSGTATIAGFDIKTHLRKVQQRIGYCPQFDAVLERLTGRELLTMFARLRGIPEQCIKEVVDKEIKRLDLDKHADKYSGTYSGGNKRKLSTAIALVGNPPVILLDEPTTGMDPATRRFLWDVLTSITQEGRSIVLTSHSMEECEALCTRLAIMVNGSFKCLGSIQHLKNKYGSGFTLHAKVKLSPTPPTPLPYTPLRKMFSFLSDRRKSSLALFSSHPSSKHERSRSSFQSPSPESPVNFHVTKSPRSHGHSSPGQRILTQKSISLKHQIGECYPPLSPLLLSQHASSNMLFRQPPSKASESVAFDHFGSPATSTKTDLLPLRSPLLYTEKALHSTNEPGDHHPHRPLWLGQDTSSTNSFSLQNENTNSTHLTQKVSFQIQSAIDIDLPDTMPDHSISTHIASTTFSSNNRGNVSSGIISGRLGNSPLPTPSMKKVTFQFEDIDLPIEDTHSPTPHTPTSKGNLSHQPWSRTEHQSGSLSSRRRAVPPLLSIPSTTSLGSDIAGFNPYDTTALHLFIDETFPGANLLEEHQGAVTYQLPSEGISWSSVFRQLEDHKERLGIVDYSVSQTTLEQVFINFAQEQEEKYM